MNNNEYLNKIINHIRSINDDKVQLLLTTSDKSTDIFVPCRLREAITNQYNYVHKNKFITYVSKTITIEQLANLLLTLEEIFGVFNFMVLDNPVDISTHPNIIQLYMSYIRHIMTNDNINVKGLYSNFTDIQLNNGTLYVYTGSFDMPETSPYVSSYSNPNIFDKEIYLRIKDDLDTLYTEDRILYMSSNSKDTLGYLTKNKDIKGHPLLANVTISDESGIINTIRYFADGIIGKIQRQNEVNIQKGKTPIVAENSEFTNEQKEVLSYWVENEDGYVHELPEEDYEILISMIKPIRKIIYRGIFVDRFNMETLPKLEDRKLESWTYDKKIATDFMTNLYTGRDSGKLILLETYCEEGIDVSRSGDLKTVLGYGVEKEVIVKCKDYKITDITPCHTSILDKALDYLHIKVEPIKYNTENKQSTIRVF